MCRGLPGGPGVESLPCNTGDISSIPGPGRSHMQLSPCAQLLSPCSRAWKPQLLKRVHPKACTTKEATAMRSLCNATKSSPHSPQLDKSQLQQ